MSSVHVQCVLCTCAMCPLYMCNKPEPIMLIVIPIYFHAIIYYSDILFIVSVIMMSTYYTFYLVPDKWVHL